MKLEFIVKEGYWLAEALRIYLEKSDEMLKGHPIDAKWDDVMDFGSRLMEHGLIGDPFMYEESKKWLDSQIDEGETLIEMLSTNHGYSYKSAVSRASEVLGGLEALRKTNEYRVILQGVESHRREIEAEWNCISSTFVSAMHDITRLSWERDAFRVYVTHPSSGHGEYYGEKRIGMGCEKLYPYWWTVLLGHEVLHDKMYFKFAGKIPLINDATIIDADLDAMATHCIIMLAADNELAFRLNNLPYPPFRGGHPNYFPAMKAILPEWERYVSSSGADIFQFKRNSNSKLMAACRAIYIAGQ